MNLICDQAVQCAWCGRWKDASGMPTGQPVPVHMAASHGICLECKSQMMSRRVTRKRAGLVLSHA
jgi:hypothetical protein